MVTTDLERTRENSNRYCTQQEGHSAKATQLDSNTYDSTKDTRSLNETDNKLKKIHTHLLIILDDDDDDDDDDKAGRPMA